MPINGSKLGPKQTYVLFKKSVYSTRALQLTPFQNPGGWGGERDGRRTDGRTEILMSNIGQKYLGTNKGVFWKEQTKGYLHMNFKNGVKDVEKV